MKNFHTCVMNPERTICNLSVCESNITFSKHEESQINKCKGKTFGLAQ